MTWEETDFSMHIFSTWGTRTCKSRMIVCSGSFSCQLVTQRAVGRQGTVEVSRRCEFPLLPPVPSFSDSVLVLPLATFSFFPPSRVLHSFFLGSVVSASFSVCARTEMKNDKDVKERWDLIVQLHRSFQHPNRWHRVTLTLPTPFVVRNFFALKVALRLIVPIDNLVSAVLLHPKRTSNLAQKIRLRRNQLFDFQLELEKCHCVPAVCLQTCLLKSLKIYSAAQQRTTWVRIQFASALVVIWAAKEVESRNVWSRIRHR